MGSIYNSIQIKKKFWLNKDNWLVSSSDDKYIKLKQTLLDSIIRSKNISDLSISVLNDIDCFTCLLNTHSIKYTHLVNKITHSKFLKNHDYILHFLKTGVIDESISQSFLNRCKSLKINQDLAFQLLSTKSDYFYFKFFKNLLKNEQFVFSLFNNKNFNNPFCLISLPYHKDITKLLIDRQGYPNKSTKDFLIKFNLSIFDDINLINIHLRKFNGHSLYNFLPQHIQNNKKISLTMLKYHPEYNILPPNLKTLPNFKQSSKFWFYYNDLIDQIRFFGNLFDNDENLFEAFTAFKHIKLSRLNNNCSFTSHPVIEFILYKSKSSSLLKEFINSEKGQYLLSLPCDSSSNLIKIDSWIHEELIFTLEKIKLYNKISNFKNLKKEKAVKI